MPNSSIFFTKVASVNLKGGLEKLSDINMTFLLILSPNFNLGRLLSEVLSLGSTSMSLYTFKKPSKLITSPSAKNGISMSLVSMDTTVLSILAFDI